jgi:hypothetical protein
MKATVADTNNGALEKTGMDLPESEVVVAEFWCCADPKSEAVLLTLLVSCED